MSSAPIEAEARRPTGLVFRARSVYSEIGSGKNIVK